MPHELQFEHAVSHVYQPSRSREHLLLTEDGTFHHLDPKGRILKASWPMPCVKDAEYFQAAGLQNGDFEAFCLVHAPDSFLVIVEFEKMISDSGYEPDLIDFSEDFGTMGFHITGSPEGKCLALYRTDRAGVLIVPVHAPAECEWVGLDEVPDRVWLTEERILALTVGKSLISAEVSKQSTL